MKEWDIAANPPSDTYVAGQAGSVIAAKIDETIASIRELIMKTGGTIAMSALNQQAILVPPLQLTFQDEPQVYAVVLTGLRLEHERCFGLFYEPSDFYRPGEAPVLNHRGWLVNQLYTSRTFALGHAMNLQEYVLTSPRHNLIIQTEIARQLEVAVKTQHLPESGFFYCSIIEITVPKEDEHV